MFSFLYLGLRRWMFDSSPIARVLRLGILLVSLVLPAMSAQGSSAPGSNDFPVPAELHAAVDFWERVYVEVSTDGGLLHDSRHLNVVYEIVDFGSPASLHTQRKRVDARRKHWRHTLNRLAAGQPVRNDLEREMLSALQTALGRVPRSQDLRAAAKRLRFQRGQRDKFHAGLERAGAYEAYIRSVFRRRGMPEDLAYLPHVESSFQPHAGSKHGAIGMWQFMPATAKRFMEVSALVDERRDPQLATVAAARLLADNYAKLGSWPLALTAYNHGAAGMARAVRTVGSSDIGVISERYQGRAFGFASRNFYAQFLAARRVASNPEPHFGVLKRHAPVRRQQLELPFYADATRLAERLAVPIETLKRMNPALRRAVWNGDKRVPRGYVLNVPRATPPADSVALLARVPASERHAEQIKSRVHVVSRGETLSHIAALHGVSVRRLVALNNLTSAHRIYAGQKLELVPLANVATAVSRPAQAVAQLESAVMPPSVAPRTVIDVPAPKSKPWPAASSAVTAAAVSVNLPPPRSADSKWRRIDRDIVIVDSGETLGHFADWLELPTRRLRELNGLSETRPIHMGQRLRLDFTRVSVQTLLERRLAHHASLERNYLAAYRITGTVDHTVSSGDNVWSLSRKRYSVPPWLVYRFNPETDLSRLRPGMRFIVPLVERISPS